jgi:CheY-like chemotaxis protein
MSGNRRALVASISGFLADMTALAGDPRHITVFVSHGSTGPTSNVLQLQCQIRAGTPLPPLSPPSPHWAAVETCFLCSAARRVCGAISKSKPQTAATLSGDYTLNLGPELRMWRHGPAAAQHQRALLAWSAVVVVDDDVTMHRWFQRYFVKTAPVAPTALHTFGDTGTFLAAAQTAQGPTSRLFDGSVLLFLDLVLPDGDGRDLCHHLRTACRSEAFVVAMTGLPSSDPTATDAHLANAGFDAVLRKPLQSAVVQALLRRCTC